MIYVANCQSIGFICDEHATKLLKRDDLRSYVRSHLCVSGTDVPSVGFMFRLLLCYPLLGP